MLTYKPLRKDFTSNGFQFTEMYREGDFAIFHKVAIPGPTRQTHWDVGFEVVVVTRHDGYEIAGTKIEPSEVYPGNEKWGSLGWTYPDLYSAELRFQKLIKGELPPQDETPSAEVVLHPPTEAHKSGRGRPRVARPTLTLPDGEFSCKELAEKNGVDYPVAFLFLRDEEAAGRVTRTRSERRSERGKPTQLFSKTA